MHDDVHHLIASKSKTLRNNMSVRLPMLAEMHAIHSVFKNPVIKEYFKI